MYKDIEFKNPKNKNGTSIPKQQIIRGLKAYLKVKMKSDSNQNYGKAYNFIHENKDHLIFGIPGFLSVEQQNLIQVITQV